MKKFIKNELKGWKKWEISWLSTAVIAIVALSLYWQDSLMGIISSTTGVICVICTGKGKLSAYIFGLINIVLYAIISYQAGFYGEVMLNSLYYLPMQFYGFREWQKNISNEKQEVVKRKMNLKNFGILIATISLLTIVYGIFLKSLGGNLPFIDAFSTVASIIAMYISVKRYTEQWLIWIVVNIISVIMWGYAFFVQGVESIATLLMWSVYLINAIIMYIKWRKEANSYEK